MVSRTNAGSVVAIGVGIGAALAASIGAVGYLLGIVGALVTFIAGRGVLRRRA